MEQFIPIVDTILTIALVVCIVLQVIIMRKQNRILENINELDKVERMLVKHTDLHDQRQILWDHLGKAHLRREGEWAAYAVGHSVGENAKDLIRKAEFPPGFNPSTDMNLREFIEDHRGNWQGIAIWVFSQHFIATLGTGIVDECLPRLAYFWDTWSFIIEDIQKYIQIDPTEMLILTWLELAKHISVDDYSGRAGKTHLFKLAKTVWTPYKESLKSKESNDAT